MNHLLHRSSLIRAGAMAALLVVGGAVAAYAALPSSTGSAADAAGSGLSRAAAQSANGQADENSADGTSTAADWLAANLDRLNSTLTDVWNRLTDGNAAAAAADAVQATIDRMGDDVGLMHAIDAVGGDHSAPDASGQIPPHPSQP